MAQFSFAQLIHFFVSLQPMRRLPYVPTIWRIPDASEAQLHICTAIPNAYFNARSCIFSPFALFTGRTRPSRL